MTFQSLNQLGKSLLEAADCEYASFDSMCLLEHCSGATRTQLMLDGAVTVKDETERQYKTLIGRRAKGEPLQYILGKWEFMGFEYFVGPGVLIPRPETEILVELAIKELEYRNQAVVFDLCAGTGCIGISIAKLCKNAKVYLIEKSPQAFEYLQKNLTNYCLDNAVALCGDVLKGFPAFGLSRPDFILANPPYIPTDQMSKLQTEVMYEPKQALDGGIEGLDFYKVLIDRWFQFINDGGFMAVECGNGQARPIAADFSSVSGNVGIVFDLNGIERVVIAHKNDF
jgi:release factor glutamine methyltransferase